MELKELIMKVISVVGLIILLLIGLDLVLSSVFYKKSRLFKKYFPDCYGEVINYISFITSLSITGIIIIIVVSLL